MLIRRSSLAALMAASAVWATVGISAETGEAYGAAPTHAAIAAEPVYGEYYSGYAIVSNDDAPSESTAQFKVPKLTCGTTTQEFGAGVEVEDNSATLIASWVEMGCLKGAAFYEGIFDEYTTATFVSFPITSGQTVSVSADMNEQSSSVSMSIVGGSSQTAAVANGTAVTGLVGTFPVVSKSGKVIAVPNFGRVSFKDAEINAVGWDTYPSADIWEFIRTTNGKQPSQGGIVQIQPGTLKPESFAVTFEHN